MKCVFCDGKVEKRKVTFIYEDDEKYLFVENVPARVCMKCGEKIYSPEVTDKLLKFAKNRFKPIKTIKVPVFDFEH
jgi:YgiT-type zinc finger domain-containing protein